MATRFLSVGFRRASSRLVVQPSIRRWFASYPPHEVVGMPSLSPTMESGTVAAWNLDVGDSFGAGDVICSVETDKATVDFEAQDDGVVAKILAVAGPADIICGTPILVTVEDAADVAAFTDFVVEAAAEPAAAAAEPTPAAPAPVVAAAPAPVAAAAPPAAASGDRLIASPLAHKLAKELGHSLAAIAGTGPGGRIIADDVKEFVPMAETAAAAAPPAATAMVVPAASPIDSGMGYTDYPLSDSARETAARLAQSKRNVPHYYLTVDLSMDALLEMRSTLNDTIGDESEKIGVYELLLKASAVAMKAVPSANAAWMDSVVRVYDNVDINVAVGNGDSLYTPVISDVGGRGVKAISNDLAAAVAVLDEDSEGELTPNFLSMGTMTVMNLGMYGIKSCAPIIREPQSCALALGAMENRIVPSEVEDELYKESVMLTATMSFDHRVVDGAVGAQWLAAFKSHVEHPATLLL
mmetsp:Transcript_14491/g.24000  ORF Transcript_14491/g.24000 Transcript_14491/m.24000 type:complete len:468 (+) Transcript_14491:86-1489(+)